MSTVRNRIAHKHFRLDEEKLKRAQKLLGTGTETETVERALDELIAESEWNRLVWRANARLLKSGIEIADVYGKLTD